MSKEYLNGQEQKSENKKGFSSNKNTVLLSLVLVLLLSIITFIVVVSLKPKDGQNENPSETQSQSVASSEREHSQGTKDFPNAGGEIPNNENEGSSTVAVCPICGSSSINAPDASGFKSCNSCDAKWAENGGATAPPTQNNVPSQPTGQGGSQPNTTPDNPGESGSQGNAQQKPADGIQTLQYFNTAINKVKTGAKSVNQKKVENYLASSPTVPGALNGIYNMLGGDSWLDEMLKDNSQGTATYTGADIKAKFPVEGESYASQLQLADVKAATCTEANGIYTIKITTLADGDSTNHKHGAGHNPKALNVILPSTVNDNIPDTAKSNVGEASIAYPSSTITITVDAATGNVLTADYDLKWTIRFTKMNATIPLGTRSSYEINW